MLASAAKPRIGSNPAELSFYLSYRVPSGRHAASRGFIQLDGFLSGLPVTRLVASGESGGITNRSAFDNFWSLL
jgi:hypothetical protein